MKFTAVRCVVGLLLVLCVSASARASEPRVFDTGQIPNDSRLDSLKHLNDYFPMHVPESAAEWNERAKRLRRQVMVATGVWPMPERTPLNPVIHGRVQRDGFTVEKVYFESIPNHFVTGLLFRPDDGKKNVKRPAVLCPHGHGGRMMDYGQDNMAALIESGAEEFEGSGRFPKLARCAGLARLGCVAFIFDMLGYEGSIQIDNQLAHRFGTQRPDFEGQDSWGLFSAQAEMRLQSIMGIQTWNSIRALDFLEQLPDVDGSRMAVTGGSGGGTQTILLCSFDRRPIAAFPNGMVSTAMQGGCTCENCSLLRLDTGNVELAALFAPKPQAMTSANDWTKEMMTKGYPELQKLYEMLGAKDDVYCREMLHFPHNYNYVSRATMYSWFNKHMHLGHDEPIIEGDWRPLTPGEASVWNDQHPKPTVGPEYERTLTKYLADQSDEQMSAIAPKDEASLKEFQDIVGGAFRAIIRRGLPQPADIKRTKVDKQQQPGYISFKDILRLESEGEELPVMSFFPGGNWNGDVVIWLHGDGKRAALTDSGTPLPEIRKLVDAGTGVVTADLFQQGEFLPAGEEIEQQRVVENPREAAAYTFCYNDTLFVRRVHDILTLVSFVRNHKQSPKRVSLMALGGAGPYAAAARAVAGDQIDRAAIDTEGFRFADIVSYRDPNFLPGAVKYGDLPSLLALSAPNPLWISGEAGKVPRNVEMSFETTGSTGNVTSSDEDDVLGAATKWLMASSSSANEN